jgi:hypothetical protein
VEDINAGYDHVTSGLLALPAMEDAPATMALALPYRPRGGDGGDSAALATLDVGQLSLCSTGQVFNFPGAELKRAWTREAGQHEVEELQKNGGTVIEHQVEYFDDHGRRRRKLLIRVRSLVMNPPPPPPQSPLRQHQPTFSSPYHHSSNSCSPQL